MRKNSDLRLCFGPRGKRPTSQTERPGMYVRPRPRHAKLFTALLPANKKTAPPLIFKKLRIFCNIYRFGIKT